MNLRNFYAGALAALLLLSPVTEAMAQQSVILRTQTNSGPAPVTAAGMGVTVADGADATAGAKADAACTTDTATCSVIANLKRQSQRLTAMIAAIGAAPMQQTGGSVTFTNSTIGVTGTFWQATQPISAAALPLPAGASTAAKQPALGSAGVASTDVLSVQGIASMIPLKTDGSATTQPVSAASLPLPAGAATSAKQPALGTAGAPATDVITVQGRASMTPLLVDGSAATQPVSAAALPLPTGAATLSAQNTGNASVATIATAAGTPADTAWTGTGAATIIQLLKPMATASLDPNPAATNNTQIGGVTTAVGNGVSGTGVLRVTVASDSTGQTALTAGSKVGLSAAATGGCTPHGLQSAVSTNATSVKASAGTLCSLNLVNTTATIYYVRLYNLAAAPTCSSATGFVKSIPVPANTNGGGIVHDMGPFGENYSTGIAYCITGGPTSTDNTNAAVGVFVSGSYF